jgi:hypothetical protein
MTCQYDITLLLAILEFCLAISEQRPYMLIKDDNKHLISEYLWIALKLNLFIDNFDWIRNIADSFELWGVSTLHYICFKKNESNRWSAANSN